MIPHTDSPALFAGWKGLSSALAAEVHPLLERHVDPKCLLFRTQNHDMLSGSARTTWGSLDRLTGTEERSIEVERLSCRILAGGDSFAPMVGISVMSKPFTYQNEPCFVVLSNWIESRPEISSMAVRSQGGGRLFVMNEAARPKRSARMANKQLLNPSLRVSYTFLPSSYSHSSSKALLLCFSDY